VDDVMLARDGHGYATRKKHILKVSQQEAARV